MRTSRAFELDVTVEQGSVIGEVSTVQAGVATCDGAGIVSTSWSSPRPATSEGAAEAFVFLGVFDQSAGDLQAGASAPYVWYAAFRRTSPVRSG